MKCFLLLSLTFLIFVIKGDCGVIINAIDKVKETAEGIKEDVHLLANQGKAFVIGSPAHEIRGPTGIIEHVPEHRGVISGFFHGIANAANTVGDGIHHIFTGDDKPQSRYEGDLALKDRLPDMPVLDKGGMIPVPKVLVDQVNHEGIAPIVNTFNNVVLK